MKNFPSNGRVRLSKGRISLMFLVVILAAVLASGPMVADAVDRLPADERAIARQLIASDPYCGVPIMHVSRFQDETPSNQWIWACGLTPYGRPSLNGGAQCVDSDLINPEGDPVNLPEADRKRICSRPPAVSPPPHVENTPDPAEQPYVACIPGVNFPCTVTPGGGTVYPN